MPVVGVKHDGLISPENMLPLPAGGSLHIGSIGIQLPTDPGSYRLDALNADEPERVRGARIDARFFPGGDVWRAFTGEITGATFDFAVEEPAIPTVSAWGLLILTLLLLTAGKVVLHQRLRPASGRRTHCPRTELHALVFGIGTFLGFVCPLAAQAWIDNHVGAFGLSPDGQNMVRVRQTTYELKLYRGEFDPRAPGTGFVPLSSVGTQARWVIQPLREARQVDLVALYARMEPLIGTH